MGLVEAVGWYMGWGVVALWVALFAWWAAGGARRIDDQKWHPLDESPRRDSRPSRVGDGVPLTKP